MQHRNRRMALRMGLDKQMGAVVQAGQAALEMLNRHHDVKQED